jgi:hypothetical protein
MRVRVWIDEQNEDFKATIFVNTSATEGPSESNPYGSFRVDYCGKEGGGGGDCMMRGFLEAGSEGISYFELEGGDGYSQSKALRLTLSGDDAGAGRLSFSEQGQEQSYAFAYDSELFRRSDGSSEQCFSRDASDPDTGMSVWRYGLYDADTGERITRQSGFPIEYEASDGKTHHGHMGYWGLWLPPEALAEVSTGSTVHKVDYGSGQAPSKTPYSLVKAEGRLMKYTKQTRTLAAIDKLEFNTWIWDAEGFFAGAEANRQYTLYWDDAAGTFKASGVVDCQNSGCENRSLDVEQPVPASYFASHGGVQGWSQALGGEMSIAQSALQGSIVSSQVEVIYREGELVYPADIPSALHCLRECPTAASMNAYFGGSEAASPYVATSFGNWGPADANAVVTYAADASAGLLRDGSGAAITFTNAQALQQRPQYQWGVRTGKLFTDLADAACDLEAGKYCDHKLGALDTYYQWETGPNQWNQFAAVKDSHGKFVSFDMPLQVSYQVPTGAQYGKYAGKSIVLQYGGFGELWGIPGHCVDRSTNEPTGCETPGSRHVPAFVIPFDETKGRVFSGSTPMLAKWLDREIRFARKDLGVCTSAGLSLPGGLTLPTAAGLQDPSDSSSAVYIGEKPQLTSAPRVIHGEVTY